MKATLIILLLMATVFNAIAQNDTQQNNSLSIEETGVNNIKYNKIRALRDKVYTKGMFEQSIKYAKQLINLPRQVGCGDVLLYDNIANSMHIIQCYDTLQQYKQLIDYCFESYSINQPLGDNKNSEKYFHYLKKAIIKEHPFYKDSMLSVVEKISNNISTSCALVKDSTQHIIKFTIPDTPKNKYRYDTIYYYNYSIHTKILGRTIKISCNDNLCNLSQNYLYHTTVASTLRNSELYINLLGKEEIVLKCPYHLEDMDELQNNIKQANLKTLNGTWIEANYDYSTKKISKRAINGAPATLVFHNGKIIQSERNSGPAIKNNGIYIIKDDTINIEFKEYKIPALEVHKKNYKVRYDIMKLTDKELIIYSTTALGEVIIKAYLKK